MKRTLISALVAGCVGLASFAAAAGTVGVNGSTTVLPAMQKISETFMAKHKDIQVSLSGGGSGHGIKALMDKTTDVAMASRDMKPAEVENVKKNGGEAVRFTVAIDAIVPIVHPKNTVKDLSLQQIRDIYAGRITNWKQVGGPDARITVVNRDSSSGTFETWEELVMKGERVQQRALLQASNGAVLQTVAKNPNAIGYVGLGYITKDIKETADSSMLAFLDRVPPEQAARVRVEPGSNDLLVWSYNGKHYVRTIHSLMWPAWTAVVNGAGNTRCYEIPLTSRLMISRNGQIQTIRLQLSK